MGIPQFIKIREYLETLRLYVLNTVAKLFNLHHNHLMESVK